MSKYDNLGNYLRKQGYGEVPMTFGEIEKIVGSKLPPSAYRHRPWWSNNPSNSVMTRVWLDAGYRTERVDMAAKKLVFKRAGLSQHGAGMAGTERRYQPSDPGSDKKVGRHPLIGSMKGTFTIEPGWDITKPAMDPEELDEMEVNTEKTADRIEKGLSGRGK